MINLAVVLTNKRCSSLICARDRKQFCLIICCQNYAIVLIVQPLICPTAMCVVWREVDGSVVPGARRSQDSFGAILSVVLLVVMATSVDLTCAPPLRPEQPDSNNGVHVSASQSNNGENTGLLHLSTTRNTESTNFADRKMPKRTSPSMSQIT